MSTIVKDIVELIPKAQEACNLFLAECEAQGLKVRITETYRSQERQNELYAQGRTKAGQIVTWTKKSRHTSRRAWDICQDIKGKEYSDSSFFKKCGAIAENLGITWGGIWKTPDTPHFEISEDWESDRMTIQEKQEFEKLKKQVETLLNSQERVYHYTTELPAWARPQIQKLLNKGVYAGAGADDLNLPETMMRILVICDRAGVFDK